VAKSFPLVAWRPWRRELVADFCLPDSVLGPVEYWALDWLARVWAADAIVFCPCSCVWREWAPGGHSTFRVSCCLELFSVKLLIWLGKIS